VSFISSRKNTEESNPENEGAKVAGDTFLDMIENTALCHVPVGADFQLDGAVPHFSSHVSAFLDWEFPDRFMGIGGGVIISSPPRSTALTHLDFFLPVVSERHCSPRISAKCE